MANHAVFRKPSWPSTVPWAGVRPRLPAGRPSVAVFVVQQQPHASMDRESPSRRNFLLSTGLAQLGLSTVPMAAEAAYGDSARVFGSKTKTSDFTQYIGDAFAVEIPAKWNPDQSIISGSKLRRDHIRAGRIQGEPEGIFGWNCSASRHSLPALISNRRIVPPLESNDACRAPQVCRQHEG